MSSFCFVSARLAIITVLILSFVCAEELSYTINEEVGAGFVVGNIAEDLPNPVEANAEFSMLTVPNETYFTLDTETGELTTTEHIDREVLCPGPSTSCEFAVDVIVQQTSGPVLVNVKVTITDINDHAPAFASDITDIAIPESVAAGTLFPLTPATDEDVGDNAIQDYRLSNEFADIFELVVNKYPDGFIYIALKVTGSLDRETRDNYEMILYADDGGDPLLSGVTLLNVTVLDSDDHSPEFVRSSYTVRVAEDVAVGQEIIQVQASDPDTGTNGQIIYSFGGSVSAKVRELFDIDATSGWLTVKAELDYEDESSHQISVRATNNVPNPVPDFATVTVDIIDVNDNRPQLVISAINGDGFRRTRILENSPSHETIAFVRVSDVDSGVNGEVTLTLEDDEGHFYLDELNPDQYFLKTAVRLDREDISVYNITILAQDGGLPVLTSRRKFAVIVIDENDNTPRFSSSVYHAAISENNEQGHRVATVQAIDEDELENGEVVYSLPEDHSGSFVIDENNGVITAETSLDREDEESIQLHVRACDRGSPQKCADAPLTIRVLDQNDNSPVFSEELISMSIPENSVIDTFVGQAVAVDADVDENGRLRYSIVTDSLFRIDESTGSIFSRAQLDRETQELYHFTVKAVDEGLSPKTATATVVVTVTDTNDHAPSFIVPSQRDNTRFVPLSAVPGFPVLKVETEDMDEDANALVSYAISSGNTHGAFGIRASGVLVTAQGLLDDWGSVHDVVIRATDGGQPGRSSTTTLRIVVADKDFNVSLPERNFTQMFNLTVDDFLDPGENLPSNSGILNEWPMIVIITLAGSAVILVIIFLLVAARCRTKNREQGKYIVPPGEGMFAIRQAKITDAAGKTSDTDSGLASTTSNLSTIPSKNIRKWRAQQDRDQDSIGSSQRGGTSKAATLPHGVSSASTMDTRLGNRQMSTFGSNSDIHSDSIASIASARRTPDPDIEVQRLLRKLRRDSGDTASERNSDCNASSYDSGHGGDSDRDIVSSGWGQNKPNGGIKATAPPGDGNSRRSSSYPRIAALAAQNVSTNKTPPGGHRPSYMASPHCTPECQTLGHSDECWMPNLSSANKPKTVHFSKYDDNRSSGGSYRSYQSNDRPPATSPKPPNPAIAFGNVSKVSQNHKPLPKGGILNMGQQSPASRDISGYYGNSSSTVTEDERNGGALPLTPIREHPLERNSQDKRNNTPSVVVTLHSPDKSRGENDIRQNCYRNDMNRTDLAAQGRSYINGASQAHRNDGMSNGRIPSSMHNGRSDSRNSSGDSRNSSTDSVSYSTSSGASSEMTPVRYSPDEVEAVLEKCGADVSSGVSPDNDRLYTDWV